MGSKLAGKVVLVTGASSGIGRATSKRLAKKGAKVVACARRLDALVELAEECERFDGEVLPLEVDVTDAAAVEKAVREAIDRFGQIDGFVNNAGVFMVGAFEDTPSDAVRQLFEVNFFGVLHGCRAVLPHFRARGEGVLVNVASVCADVPAPWVSAYVASKFAVRGFSAALRQELFGSGISVCTVLPAAIDTPLWDHTANFSGEEAKPISPVYSPDKVAKVICRVLVRPDDEVFAGAAGPLFSAMRTLMPETQDRVMRKVVDSQHFTGAPEAENAGNLYRPLPEGTGTRSEKGYRSGLRRWLARGAMIAAVPAAVAAVRRALM